VQPIVKGEIWCKMQDGTQDDVLPRWLPGAARLYIEHVGRGHSLRALARARGLHPSTILRQVRRFENRRDDPLVDEALERLARSGASPPPDADRKDPPPMSAPIRSATIAPDDATVEREARRILRRLAEPGAVLAIAPDMEKAVVLRELPDGRSARTGVLDRAVAQAFALKDWIACRKPGRVAAYGLTAVGRAALKRLIEAETQGAEGMAEAAAPFAAQHGNWTRRALPDPESGAPRPTRCNLAESPIMVLGRRRDKDGAPFLDEALIAAAERLREDFELAQMGPRVAQNWDRFLTAGADRGLAGAETGPAEGPRAARDRVAAALRDLGPGLGDMALRCCCYLEGLETAEKRMGWSARSGKIVLRIALQRLRRHYEETGTGRGPLIG
jgi:hypothetical protein